MGLGTVGSTVLVLVASSTFFLPLLAGYLLLLLARGLGWPNGPAMAVSLCLAYYFGSYWSRPERRQGRCIHKLNRFWTLCHDYFPVRLWVWDGERPSDIPRREHAMALPKDPFLLCLHPHGPFPLSASVLMPQLSLFGSKLHDYIFEKTRFAAASAVFWLPFVRDMYLALGCIEASRRTLTAALTKGFSVAIMPGGELEQLLVCPPELEYEDVVTPRPGLLKLAVSQGAPIIPAFAFGERRAYTSSTMLLSLRLRWVRKYRIGIPFAWGRFPWFPFVPRQEPIAIVLGKPLLVEKVADPSTPQFDAAVSALRQRYEAAFTHLFDAHKAAHGAGHKTLRWVDQEDAVSNSKAA